MYFCDNLCRIDKDARRLLKQYVSNPSGGKNMKIS